MRSLRVAAVLALSCAGCAHWGTTNVGHPPTVPSVTSTYLAPARPELAAEVAVPTSTDPPPAGSVVLAVSSVRCSSTQLPTCLRALLDETHRLGGNGLYGVHTESAPRVGTSLVGSVTFDAAPAASIDATSPRETEIQLRPQLGSPPVDIFVERRDPDLVLRGPPDGWSVESWRPLCKLPCSSSLEPNGSYRLVAPALSDSPPVAITPASGDRIDVTLRKGAPDYSRVWWGLGITLVSGGVGGGTLAYFLTNPGNPSGAAELTVGLLLLPCILLGIEDLLLGPVNRLEIATSP